MQYFQVGIVISSHATSAVRYFQLIIQHQQGIMKERSIVVQKIDYKLNYKYYEK